jgi:NADH-quinone oxidoreductase subunit J
VADLLFGGFWSLCALFAFVAVMARKPIYNAIALAVVILELAVMYVYLGYDFIAALQVLVYFGAVVVAILFLIMLSPLNTLKERLPSRGKIAGAFATGFCFFATFFFLLYRKYGTAVLPAIPDKGNIREVGLLLATRYALPFELISLILLVAILGAIVVARKDD